MSKLSETLKELMEEQSLTAKRLSEITGIPAPTVTRYKNGTITPNIKNLIILADCFNCSTDYLLGLESENERLIFKTCPPFCEQINLLVQKSGLNNRAFYLKYKIPESSFFEWKNGSSIPSLENVQQLAKNLDCRVDFVLGRES